MELFACRLACGGWEGWEGGQTERAAQSMKDREEQSGGNVGATHIETHFHESVEDRLSPMLDESGGGDTYRFGERDRYRGVFIIAAHRAFVSGCEGSSIAELRSVVSRVTS